jgi:hypothetical protein
MNREETWLTFDQDSISSTDESPDVSSPVGVIESALEREEARNDLLELRGTASENERSERKCADRYDYQAKFDESIKLEACSLRDRVSFDTL